jgi:isoleucyl-tRNA synthetase
MTGKHVARASSGLGLSRITRRVRNCSETIIITHCDQVLEMGIDKNNATCRSFVARYTKEWESMVTAGLGRWIDFENDYRTMDPNLWNLSGGSLNNCLKRNWSIRDTRSCLILPIACTTPISIFEAGLNYKDIKDPAVVVSFPIVGEEDVSFVIWTTNPWTLPSNLSLCVNSGLDYVQILNKKSPLKYILGSRRLAQMYPIMNTKK